MTLHFADLHVHVAVRFADLCNMGSATWADEINQHDSTRSPTHSWSWRELQ